MKIIRAEAAGYFLGVMGKLAVFVGVAGLLTVLIGAPTDTIASNEQTRTAIAFNAQ